MCNRVLCVYVYFCSFNKSEFHPPPTSRFICHLFAPPPYFVSQTYELLFLLIFYSVPVIPSGIFLFYAFLKERRLCLLSYQWSLVAPKSFGHVWRGSERGILIREAWRSGDARCHRTKKYNLAVRKGGWRKGKKQKTHTHVKSLSAFNCSGFSALTTAHLGVGVCMCVYLGEKHACMSSVGGGL